MTPSEPAAVRLRLEAIKLFGAGAEVVVGEADYLHEESENGS